jgi:hypothetical protein
MFVRELGVRHLAPVVAVVAGAVDQVLLAQGHQLLGLAEVLALLGSIF